MTIEDNSVASIITANRDHWIEGVCRTLLEGDCRLDQGEQFHGELTSHRSSALSFSIVRSVKGRFDRTQHHIRRSEQGEVVLVILQRRGSVWVAQDGRQELIKPGDFTCTDSTKPMTMTFDESFDNFTVHVPRLLVANAMGRIDRLTAQPFMALSPLGPVVSRFLQEVSRVLNKLQPATVQKVSDIAFSLILATLADVSGRVGNDDWGRPALLHRAQTYIDAHARDHTLSSNVVAAFLGISTRYLQGIFRDQGSTPSEYIWSNRLEKCRCDLGDASLDGLSVGDIALRAGFQDFAHFSHRFKAAFGISAREYRHECRVARLNYVNGPHVLWEAPSSGPLS